MFFCISLSVIDAFDYLATRAVLDTHLSVPETFDLVYMSAGLYRAEQPECTSRVFEIVSKDVYIVFESLCHFVVVIYLCPDKVRAPFSPS